MFHTDLTTDQVEKIKFTNTDAVPVPEDADLSQFVSRIASAYGVVLGSTNAEDEIVEDGVWKIGQKIGTKG